MQDFVVFFENGNNAIIRADKIIDSDNYINFFIYTKTPDNLTKDSLVAQFAKSKISGYSRRDSCEV